MIRKLLRSKSSINGIKIEENLIQKVKYELGKRDYKNYTFNMEEFDLPYGLLYEAIVEVIKNNFNFDFLNKEVFLEKMKKKINKKRDEINHSKRKMPI